MRTFSFPPLFLRYQKAAEEANMDKKRSVSIWKPWDIWNFVVTAHVAQPPAASAGPWVPCQLSRSFVPAGLIGEPFAQENLAQVQRILFFFLRFSFEPLFLSELSERQKAKYFACGYKMAYCFCSNQETGFLGHFFFSKSNNQNVSLHLNGSSCAAVVIPLGSLFKANFLTQSS